MEIISKTIEKDEEYLRQISKEVLFPDLTLLDDLARLEDFCRSREVFALAAVQIGIPKRIIYLKNTNLERYGDTLYNEERVMINPIVLERSGDTTYWEACVSCLDYTGLVHRPYRMKIQYQDREQRMHVEELEGFEATVFSHEYDHLNGVLHMDIAVELLVLNGEERKEFRKTHPYQILSQEGPYLEPIPKRKEPLNLQE